MIQEQLFISELFKDIQDTILLILIAGQCCDSEQILPIHLPCWMCVQSSFYHQLWNNTWRSKFEQETEVIQTRSSEDSKSLNVEQTHDRTARPVATLLAAEAQDSSRVRSAHESNTFNIDDELLRKRMEKYIADHDENHEPMMVNEADMDFRIPGLPHSVVKHAQSTSVRQLIQNIENHPDRHALQKDLRQNQNK